MSYQRAIRLFVVLFGTCSVLTIDGGYGLDLDGFDPDAVNGNPLHPIRIRDEISNGCGPDEYFDGVVSICQKCAEVCKPPCSVFCFNNCPEFFNACKSGNTIAFTSSKLYTSPSVISLSTSPSIQKVQEAHRAQIMLVMLVFGCVALLLITAIIILATLWRRALAVGRERGRALLSRQTSAASSSPGGYSRSCSHESTSTYEKRMPLINGGYLIQENAGPSAPIMRDIV